MIESIKVIKKDGKLENFNTDKIIIAIGKSARRVNKKLADNENQEVINGVIHRIKEDNINEIAVKDLHEIVQTALSFVDEEVFREYMSYRDYKKRFTLEFEKLIDESKRIIYNGDKENANKNSLLVSTKKGLVVNELAKKIMLEYVLPKELSEAHKRGDIYIHDLGDRFFNEINCCLFDMGNLLDNGFLLNGVQYTEPTSAESFMRVFSDIILEASSQQYGGFTTPEIDSVGAKYVRKALIESKKYYSKVLGNTATKEKIEELAYKYVERGLEQGFQAIETKLNSISNSNMQTPFVTLTFGLETSEEGRMITKAILKNRQKGIGKQHLTPVFPKLVFLHRNGINGQEGDKNYDLYNLAIDTMLTRMYPDQLSLDGGFLGEVFDKYGLAISPMGCRAFLSLYYIKGGMYPQDENDIPIFTGRANCGAITLNTVRYAIESKGDINKYFKLIDKNFDLITKTHLFTYDSLKDVKASSNPLFFCEGGCHIKLDYDDTIEEAIKTFTWSYGYIGLNEASLLMTGKEIHEDNSFALEVLKYLNKRIDEAKKEHGLLFALYGTPKMLGL